MRIKPGFELRMICGESIIIAQGKESVDSTKLMSLNDSAALIWNELFEEDSFELSDMVDVILENYEVDEATAKTDCEEILTEWKNVGLIEE